MNKKLLRTDENATAALGRRRLSGADRLLAPDAARGHQSVSPARLRRAGRVSAVGRRRAASRSIRTAGSKRSRSSIPAKSSIATRPAAAA